MSVRRSPDQERAEGEWARFVAANLKRIDAAGLPRLATHSVSHWDDLLLHGHFKHHADPSSFAIGSLREDQYTAFVHLVESYFLAGYEYFTPTALKLEDRRRLASRFGA